MFKVHVFNPGHPLLEKLCAMAFSNFHCHAVMENQLEEIDVDTILAEDSYCGGDVPEHVLQKLDDAATPNPAYYFADQSDAAQFSNWAKETFHLKSTIVEEPIKDWNQEWKKHYAPILLGRNFWIVPAWEKPPLNDQYIMINPGQGFGTGSHPTTNGCLEALLHYQTLLKSQQNTTLDFGCGSGILGIAFLKLINGTVDFCDIDQNALDNCYDNIKINNLDTTSYTLITRQDFRPRSYSVIFANILLNILIEESDIIRSALKTDGLLILSGILDGQIDELLDHYHAVFPFKEELRLMREKWVTLVLRRL